MEQRAEAQSEEGEKMKIADRIEMLRRNEKMGYRLPLSLSHENQLVCRAVDLELDIIREAVRRKQDKPEQEQE